MQAQILRACAFKGFSAGSADRIPSAADTKTGSMTLPVFVFGCSQTFSATLAALPTRPRR